jgi:hypothetical protein
MYCFVFNSSTFILFSVSVTLKMLNFISPFLNLLLLFWSFCFFFRLLILLPHDRWQGKASPLGWHRQLSFVSNCRFFHALYSDPCFSDKNSWYLVFRACRGCFCLPIIYMSPSSQKTGFLSGVVFILFFSITIGDKCARLPVLYTWCSTVRRLARHFLGVLLFGKYKWRLYKFESIFIAIQEKGCCYRWWGGGGGPMTAYSTSYSQQVRGGLKNPVESKRQKTGSTN